MIECDGIFATTVVSEPLGNLGPRETGLDPQRSDPPAGVIDDLVQALDSGGVKWHIQERHLS
jgi:hypothetical protein